MSGYSFWEKIQIAGYSLTGISTGSIISGAAVGLGATGSMVTGTFAVGALAGIGYKAHSTIKDLKRKKRIQDRNKDLLDDINNLYEKRRALRKKVEIFLEKLQEVKTIQTVAADSKIELPNILEDAKPIAASENTPTKKKKKYSKKPKQAIAKEKEIQQRILAREQAAKESRARFRKEKRDELEIILKQLDVPKQAELSILVEQPVVQLFPNVQAASSLNPVVPPVSEATLLPESIMTSSHHARMDSAGVALSLQAQDIKPSKWSLLTDIGAATTKAFGKGGIAAYGGIVSIYKLINKVPDYFSVEMLLPSIAVGAISATVSGVLTKKDLYEEQSIENEYLKNKILKKHEETALTYLTSLVDAAMPKSKKLRKKTEFFGKRAVNIAVPKSDALASEIKTNSVIKKTDNSHIENRNLEIGRDRKSSASQLSNTSQQQLSVTNGVPTLFRKSPEAPKKRVRLAPLPPRIN